MHIELPLFSLLVLAPFSPSLESENPPLIKTDPADVDFALAELNPALDISLDRSRFPVASINISISKMADFRPKNISRTAEFKEIVSRMDEAGSPAASPQAHPEKEPNVLDDILSMVDSETPKHSTEPPKSPERPKTELLQAIFADPEFRKMESAWRGLEMMARQVPSGSETDVNFTLVPISQNNLPAVLARLEEVYSATPPDLIVMDHGLSNSPRSMDILEKMMNFAEFLITPAMVSFEPSFLELKNWAAVDKLPFIPSLLEGAEYGRWKTLRQQPSAGWIMGCAGNIMGRTMHTPEQGFDNTSLSERGPLWISSVWAAAALCLHSLAKFDRGTLFADHSAIRLEGLPLAEVTRPSPVNPPIGTERIKDFRQSGINTLAFNGDQAFFLGAVSIDGGPLNLRLYLSRLIHFLIILSTEKRDEFVQPESQLTEVVALFLQKQGYASDHVTIKKGESSSTTIPLEISVTPGMEITGNNEPITFGFNW